MDWKKHIEPYFEWLGSDAKNAVVTEIVKRIPPTPTLESQQEMYNSLMGLIPQIVELSKKNLCASVQDATKDMYNVLDQDTVAKIQTMLLSMSCGKHVQLGKDETLMMTGNFSSTGKIVDTTTFMVGFDTELIEHLWKYFRIYDPECIKMFPNNKHLTIDVPQEKLDAYLKCYEYVKPIFSKFITIQKGTLTFCDGGTNYLVVQKDSNAFQIATYQIEGIPTEVLNVVNVADPHIELYIFDCTES